MLGEKRPSHTSTVFWHLLRTRSSAGNATRKVSHDLDNPAEKVKSPFGR